MEAAATPLRPTRVVTLLGRLIVENLVVDDPVTAELVRARVEAGADLDGVGDHAHRVVEIGRASCRERV